MTPARARAWPLAARCLLAALAPAPAAHAQPAPREAVEFTVAAEPAVAAAAEDVARDLLATLPVALTHSRAVRVDPEAVASPPPGAARPGALAHAWLDLTDRDVATLYVLAFGTERVLVRRFDRVGRSSPVVLEAAGHALVTALEALLAGETIGVSRDEFIATLRPPPPPPPAPPPPPPAPPPPPPPPPPPAPSPAWVDVDLGWEVSGWSGQVAALHGPRVAVAAGGAVHPRVRLGGEATGNFRLHESVQTADLALTLRPVASIRASVALDWRVAPALRLRVTLGVGLDAIDHDVAARSPAVVLQPGSTRLSAVTRAAVALRWRVAGPLILGATAGFEVDGAPIDFILERGGASELVVDPWPVHPVGAVTVGTTWGAGPGW